MKRILLTSTALVAFAGAAAAEAHTDADGVNFAGGAELTFNDNDGFEWSADMTIMFRQELNGGLTVGADFGVDLADNNSVDEGQELVSTGYVLSLESDIATLKFGDTDPAADLFFDDVDGMEFAGFNDRDDHLDGGDDAPFDAILYGDVMFGGATVAMSTGVNAEDTETDALQVGASATFGAFTVTGGYQEALGAVDDVYAASVAGSFAGADVKLAYGYDGDETSTGIDVAYPVGPVVIGGYYTLNDVADDNYGVRADYASGPIAISAFYDYEGTPDTDDYGIEGSYDLQNGLVLFAGAVDSFDDYYAAAQYDLGGGAQAFASYVEDGGTENDDNEIGADDRARGTTVGVSFSF